MAKLNVNLTSFLHGLGDIGWSESMAWEAFQKWQQENNTSLSFSMQVKTTDDFEKYRKFIDKQGSSWPIVQDAQDPEKVEMLIALNPQAIILQFEHDFRKNYFPSRRSNLQLDLIAQMALRAKSKEIDTHVIMEPIPHKVVEVGKLGVDLIWLNVSALETEKDIEQYVTCARIIVDLGVKIGIGPVFTSEKLNWILKEVPHIEVLMVGQQFFKESFYKGITANLATYLKHIRNY